MSRSSQHTTPTMHARTLPTNSTPSPGSPITSPEHPSLQAFPTSASPALAGQNNYAQPQPRRQTSFSPIMPSGTATTSVTSQSFALPGPPSSTASLTGLYPSLGPLDASTPPPISPAKKFARPTHAATLGETSRNISSNSLQHLYDALRASAGNAGGSGGSGLNHGGQRGSLGAGVPASPSLTQGFVVAGGPGADDGDGNFGITSPRGPVQPLPRSRRSSVAMAVSVSLASRSRSHTPVQQDGAATNGRIGSPPLSPGRLGYGALGLGAIEGRRPRGSRRSSRDDDAGFFGPTTSNATERQRQIGRSVSALIADGSAKSRQSHSRAPSGEFDPTLADSGYEQDMHWEETFENDDLEELVPGQDRTSRTVAEDDVSMRSATLVDEAGREMRKLVLDSLQEEDDMSIPGSVSGVRQAATASEIDSTRQPSRSTSFGSTSAVDHDMIDDMDASDGSDGCGDVFRRGERFGPGIVFEGEVIEELDPVARLEAKGRTVPGGTAWQTDAQRITGNHFEVVRKLGSGSYAVVYLVREVGGSGQEYALKCLSKRDLEEESLDIQLFEATIHMSLPRHDNIVTLYQTLQTGKWLFLLMEMCPGEDLFFWLEHSRDSPPESTSSTIMEPIPAAGRHAPPLSSSNLPSSAVPFSSSAMMAGMRHSPLTLSSSPAFTMSKSHVSHMDFSNHHSATPTTPSLLAASSANSLLAYRRLRLIASMFVQMCEAVSLCHQAGVSHRDIKPENFICCDSEDLASTFPDSARIGGERKKVVVKLTDFGLATTEANSGDVECGSRPYMAYECRNELGPDYAPRPADVWSLGIVLLNMLFHRNPWTDPAPGNKNFDGFLEDPVDFLLTRFTGIGREVATYLAHRVFALRCEQRVTAGELANWAKDLPAMITGRRLPGAPRVANPNGGPREKDELDFTKSPVEAKGFTSAFSQFSSLSRTAPREQSDGNGANEDVEVSIETAISNAEAPDLDEDDTVEGDASSRTPSATKRKKRGARKGKAAQAAAAALLAGMPGVQTLPTVLPSVNDDLLVDLAEASQALAREVSSVSKGPDRLTVEDFPRLGEEAALVEAKKSKWKGIAKLSSGNPELQALAQKVKEKEGVVSAPGKLQNTGRSKSHNKTTSQQQSFGAASHTPSLTFDTSSTSSVYLSNRSIHSQTSSINDLDSWRRPAVPIAPVPLPPLRPAATARKSAEGGWAGLLEQTSALALASQIAQPLAQSAALYTVPSRAAPSIASASSKGSMNSFFYKRNNASVSTLATTVSSRSALSQFSLPPKPIGQTEQGRGVAGIWGRGEEKAAEGQNSVIYRKSRPQPLDLPGTNLEAIDERPSLQYRSSDASSFTSQPHSAASASGSMKSQMASMGGSSPTSPMSSSQGPSGQKLKQQISKMFTGLKREKSEVVK